jgi:hypothetical protein
VLPSAVDNASASQIYVVFGAQWLAYAIPYRRFTADLADDSARLGADVVRYSFIVMDFHHLLLAGLTGARPPYAVLLASSIASAAAAETPLPDALKVPGESVVLSAHAEGAQVYECKAGPDGKPAWAFREPIATLLFDGKTIGRHYAGPNWEDNDGSAVTGKVAACAPGATPDDIPWLKLQVVSSRGSGILSGVTTVQRINTSGGKIEGACDKAGSFRSAPYSADYVFLRKG